MSEYKKIYFPSIALKNHFIEQFQKNRYSVLDPGREEDYFSFTDDYKGQALYYDEYDINSDIDYKKIVAHFSGFPSYYQEFPEINYEENLKFIHTLNEAYTHKEIDQFKKGIFYCSKDKLPDLLPIAFEDTFFNKFPNGKIISVRLDSLHYTRSAMIRALYSIINYPDIKDEIKDFEGFATLRNWLFTESHEYFGNIIQLAQYFFFPFITAFHCNYRVGLTFIFVPDRPIEYKISTFPRDILDYVRTSTDFGKEKIKNIQWTSEHLYSKYCFANAPTHNESYEFILWAVKSANKFIKENLNICNYVKQNDTTTIDPIFALEYNFTILHLIKVGLSILASNSSYFNKSMTFQSADIYSDICNYNNLRHPAGSLFKKLFNKDDILPILQPILNSCSFSLRVKINEVLQQLYNNLNDTIKESIWLKYKITGDNISVKNRNGTGNNSENISVFTGNVIRALRNTHHGYLTRNDQGNRPSRYLSIIDGNIPDNIGSLPLIWLICLIQDRNSFIGEP